MIPLDLAANAIIELRDSTVQTVHVAHPKPTSWNVMFTYIAKTLNVPLAPYPQWLSRLEASESEQAVEKNSALRLLEFYKTFNTDPGLEAGGSPKLSMEEAVKISSALDTATALDEKDFQKWLDYWKNTGIISF